MIELLQENWKIAVGVVGALAVFWPQLAKVKDWMMSFGGKFLSKSTKVAPVGVEDVDDVEKLDLQAIVYLRKRATTLKNNDLVKEIKDVYVKFYDMYTTDGSDASNKGN